MLALWFAGKPVNPKKTYGYYRMEILAALGNGVALILISLLISYEAVSRISRPQSVLGLEATLIALGGLLINGASAWALQAAAHENLNMRGAFLHTISDALGSIGAIAAGLLIWLGGWYVADPVISIGLCVLIIFGSWQLIRESINILLEGAPPHISVSNLIASMHQVENVLDVHDLHVWTISSGKDALSAHVTIETGASHKETLESLRQKLRSEFNISHVTLQLESPEDDPGYKRRLYQIRPRNEAEDRSRRTSGRSEVTQT
jgi:cobalt-zinc-cadmium efflux system protein